MANTTVGKITQIIGAVLDIKFTEGKLPEINDAIDIPLADGKKLVVEVSQHLGDDTVRCIAMGPTDGLVRGMDAVATGSPICVPVGEATRAADRQPGSARGRGALSDPQAGARICRAVDRHGDPGNGHQGSRSAVPVSERRKDRLVRRRGRRKDRADPGADPEYRDRARRIFRIYRSRGAYQGRKRPVP